MTEPALPLRLLGGLSPAQFMRRHWQKKPLLVRQAVTELSDLPVERTQLFELAQRLEVESRLITRFDGQWQLRHGPLRRRALPPLQRPNWTLLVQGVDRHDEAAHRMVHRHFDFLSAARFDDLMVSYASAHGGVGPHVDRYDVFLLQARGCRRWRIGQPKRAGFDFIPDLPLKILSKFEPDQDYLLEPGDMLYLPPNWAHEGTAVGGDCVTCSIGYRTPTQHELAVELLSRIADRSAELDVERRFCDPTQPAVVTPGSMPVALIDFAHGAVAQALQARGTVERALGELLSEPHASVWFEAVDPPPGPEALQPPLRLDRRSRMLYDARCIYLNGESRQASGREARTLRKLADRRQLDGDDLRRCQGELQACLLEWLAAGWLHTAAPTESKQGDRT